MLTFSEMAAKSQASLSKAKVLHPRVLISRLDQPRAQIQNVARAKATQFKNHVTTTFRTPLVGLETGLVL